ncbi:MAG TPA: HAD-IIIC family phosphatase [Baekduia sp.]|nr:HAD-IIIC family phosphatase [Baekduia sp.]
MPAADLAAHRDALVALWERLGEEGPTFGREIEPDPANVRRRFLVPLALMLEGALNGSDVHRASYLEARVAYLPKALPGPERAALFTRLLTAEGRQIADLAGNAPLAQELDVLHAPLMAAPQPGDPRVVFVGDCLFSEVRCFLSERSAAQTGRTLDGDHIYFSSGIEPLDPDVVRRSIASAPPTVVGLSLFSFNGVPAYTALVEQSLRRGALDLDAPVQSLITMLGSAIEAVRQVTEATILVHSPCSLPLSPKALKVKWLPAEPRRRRRLIEAITAGVRDLVASTENTILIEEAAIVEREGGLRAMAAPVLGPEFDAAYAHHSRLGAALADEYAEILKSYNLFGKAKALLVDFDNTLWKGVMGDGPVTQHPERQRLLKRLREAGVLLVALSKNDPETIRWDELELDPDDFVLHQVNWRPKPDNVSEAIAALDLAPDAFVLLDDNPVECALVCENVPGVRALDPEDPFAWRALERWLDFPSTKQTDEARRRTELYREAAERNKALGGQEHDYEQMMRSLDLRAQVRPATAQDRDRLLELIQRTNQFNTTTVRRSATEVDALLGDDAHTVLVASLQDRFGDLGVVAVAIARRHAPGHVTIDSFIMSCRAMGFGLEQYVLARLMAEVPAARYEAPFVPTERNGPAASLYPANGFAEAEPGRWVLDADAERPAEPAWFNGRPARA